MISTRGCGRRAGPRRRRGEVDGVREGGRLVAEIGARDHCPGGNRGREMHLLGHAHQADADRGDNGPGAADADRHERADDAGGNIKIVRAEHGHRVVDHGHERAAHRPGADQGADGEEDKDRRQGGGDAGDHRARGCSSRRGRSSRRCRRPGSRPGSGPPDWGRRPRPRRTKESSPRAGRSAPRWRPPSWSGRALSAVASARGRSCVSRHSSSAHPVSSRMSSPKVSPIGEPPSISGTARRR